MKESLWIKDTDNIIDLLYKGLYPMAFQPIIESQGGKLFGFEALLRGPEGTPMAEPEKLFGSEPMLCGELLAKVDIACIGSALQSGRDLALNHRLFINTHICSLVEISNNYGIFLKYLDDLGISSKNIVFEVSERTKYDCITGKLIQILDFFNSDIRLALDDIGASFDWLHHMLAVKPKYLKVDKSFIKGMNLISKQALVKSLTMMSRKMGMDLIAEGIEDSETLQAMQNIGVKYLQGFMIGRPGPADKWLDEINENGSIWQEYLEGSYVRQS